MADLNKFQRSKDRIAEILNQLRHISVPDEGTDLYINVLQQSLTILDNKIEEFQIKKAING